MTAQPAAPTIAAPAVPQNPRLGLTFSNYFANNPMYARAREAGASYDRIEFQMGAIQPSQGQWTWQAYDTLVANETANGLQVLAVLTSPPQWAGDPGLPPTNWFVPANLTLPWNDPGNYWAQFVYQTVLRYRATIKAWQVWNEPDTKSYWNLPQAPASLFAQLLRVSYQAIKAADPQATVVLGGFLYRHDQWPSPITLWNAIRDLPDSVAYNNYFDVAALHLYDGGTCETFDVIEDFRLNMTRADRGGLRNHPIWVTESGIRHWEGYAGSPPPGSRFAWPNEAASYVIQNYAYALSKNVGRYYYFRTTDDGSMEQWGLIRPDASLRPAYYAYQVAAQYLPATFNFSTRDWTNSDSVSRISFWGTPLGRVSVIWNISNTSQTYVFNSVLPTATLILQNGSASALSFTNYQYTFTLSPAPNFTWHNPPDQCLVASPPLIVIERDITPPVAALQSLPVTTTQTAIQLHWSGSDDAAGVWSYDLQYRVNAGAWITTATWLNTTTRVFNGQRGATYAFRVRARDRAGNEQAWDAATIATTTVPLPNLRAVAFVPLAVVASQAPVCETVVVNGGFENNAGWAINSTPYPATYTTALARTGLRSIQTGIPLSSGAAPTSFSSISQTFVLPASTPLHLTLWRNAQTQDTDDLSYARVWDGAGVLHTLDESRAASPGWQPLSFDLSAFAGQRITLLIGAYNDGDNLKTVAYYDDIALACQGPSQ